MILNIDNWLSDIENDRLNYLQLNIKKLNKWEIIELKLLVEKEEWWILKKRKEFDENR